MGGGAIAAESAAVAAGVRSGGDAAAEGGGAAAAASAVAAVEAAVTRFGGFAEGGLFLAEGAPPEGAGAAGGFEAFQGSSLPAKCLTRRSL